MSRTPRFNSSSGLAGLGLVLLAVLLVGGVAYFFLAGTPVQGRGAQAAERRPAPAPAAESEPEADEARGAAPVELLPAGASLVPAEAPVAAAQASEAEPAPLALDAPTADPLAMTVAPTDGKAEGPELRYVREGKVEEINGREQRRERRNDRKERAAEAEALGLPAQKRAVESSKKNASRSQVEKVGAKEPKPARRPKTPPAKDEAQGAPAGG